MLTPKWERNSFLRPLDSCLANCSLRDSSSLVMMSVWRSQKLCILSSTAFVAMIQIVFEQSTVLRFLRSWYSPKTSRKKKKGKCVSKPDALPKC